MSLSVALKFIYRLASRAKSDHCLTQNEMLKEIKSKVCESCHSLHCSPTHPCRASDGEKLFFFFKNTHIVHPDILFMWMEAAQMLVDGTVRQKENVQIGQTCLCSAIFMESCWSKGFHVCFHCFSRARWRAWTQTSYFILFFWKSRAEQEDRNMSKAAAGRKKKEFSQDESMSGRDCHFHFRSSFLEFVQVSEHVWASPHDQNLLS